MTEPARVETVGPGDFPDALPELVEILRACVAEGASVGFIHPFGPRDAEAWWRRVVAPALAEGTRRLLVARVGDRRLGTAQIDIATPANQRHRADVMKVLVHPDGRRRGLARLLMTAIEAEARALDRTLLTLDTRVGDAAERLYRGLGYVAVGAIPDFALAPEGGRLDATLIMYKRLAPGTGGAGADSL